MLKRPGGDADEKGMGDALLSQMASPTRGRRVKPSTGRRVIGWAPLAFFTVLWGFSHFGRIMVHVGRTGSYTYCLGLRMGAIEFSRLPDYAAGPPAGPPDRLVMKMTWAHTPPLYIKLFGSFDVWSGSNLSSGQRHTWFEIGVPLWWLVILSAAWFALLAYRRRIVRAGYCAGCGYDLHGNPNARTCPECGKPVSAPGHLS